MKADEIVLDETDLHILRSIQHNARISNAELARELGMAPSGVLERVKKLEKKKVILEYNTQINPAALQQKLLAFVMLKVSPGHDYQSTAGILMKIPEVLEVHHIAGEDCYLLKVRTRDTDTLMHLMRSNISAIPQLLTTRTTIVLETIKEQQHVVIA